MHNNRSGLISEIDIKTSKYRILYCLFIVIMIIVALVCIAPPLYVMLSAAKDINEFYAIPPTIIPKTWDFQKIMLAWHKFDFVRYYLNTIVFTIGCIVTSIIVNGLAGYVLSKMKTKGINLIFVLIIWSLMLPNTVSMVPAYENILKFPILHLNLINTNIPIFMMYGARAFKVIVFKSFFDGIPDSLIEAAKIDGCNDFKIFPQIVLPLSKPVVMTMVILTFREAWSEFFWPLLVLREKAKYTVMVEMYAVQTQIPMDELVILISFSIIPPILLFIFFQKYIIQGFTLSGIKG